MTRMSDKIDSKFRYILVAATRAEQIMRGAPPKVEAGPDKPTRIAMKEVTGDLVPWEIGPPPQPEPDPEMAEEAGDEADPEVN